MSATKSFAIGIIIGITISCLIVLLFKTSQEREIIHTDSAVKKADSRQHAMRSNIIENAQSVVDLPPETRGEGIGQVRVGMAQEDEELIAAIRAHHIYPPSILPYNLVTKHGDTSVGQAQIIRELLKDKRNGMFVECGALDGETRSNTLTLEKDLGWTGVLVEADPETLKTLLAKNRKAHTVGNCLSVASETMNVTYKTNFNVGHIANLHASATNNNAGKMKNLLCLPFYSLMRALEISHVDYFSLDVEGNELQVLKTIPFDKIDISTLSVEYSHIGKSHGEGSRHELVTFMKSNGYKVRAKVTNRGGLANDIIFAKIGLNEDVHVKSIHL